MTIYKEMAERESQRIVYGAYKTSLFIHVLMAPKLLEYAPDLFMALVLQTTSILIEEELRRKWNI